MVSQEHVCTRMGVLQWRCTRHLLCALPLLEAAGAFTLMFYALLWEGGNLVNLPDKRIGFFNFCLWNETARKLQCLESTDLQMMDISLPVIMLARVFVYACLVFIMFYFIFVAHVMFTDERDDWKVILIILTFKLLILSVGLGMFLSETLQCIHLSDLTGGFLALLGTLALLLLQIFTAAVYPSWAKHTLPCESPFTSKVLLEI